jgi:hypothetical protein
MHMGPAFQIASSVENRQTPILTQRPRGPLRRRRIFIATGNIAQSAPLGAASKRMRNTPTLRVAGFEDDDEEGENEAPRERHQKIARLVEVACNFEKIAFGLLILPLRYYRLNFDGDTRV